MVDRALDRLQESFSILSIGDAFLKELDEFFQVFPNEKILVLVDEFDELYRPGIEELKVALRNVIQQEEKLTWIFSSTYFTIREQKDYGSPWFNILDILTIDVLDIAAAKKLILDPSRKEKVYWENNAQTYILEQTGCHPALLQLACKSVIDHLNEIHSGVVSSEIISDVLEEMCENETVAKTYFDTYWISEGMPVLHPLILLAVHEHYPTGLSRLEL